MNQAMLQALQEKGVAEQMMVCNDYASAREHLLRAHQLFPAMDNIDAMLTVCDILTAAGVELPGCGIDYYWVLQVMRSSTFTDVRCRYQKLFTLLQPIRKNFPCTELALRLLQNALIVLTDHKKRSVFDMKRDSSWENYGSFDEQASTCCSISTEEMVTTSQNCLAHQKNSSSKICDGGSKPAEMFPKDVGTFVVNEVNFQGIHKRQIDINVEELNKFSSDTKFGGNTQADVGMCVDGTNLSTMLQPASLEGYLYSSATMQKRPFQDFYNFENDRKFDHFEAGQIWAVHYKAKLHHNYRYAQIVSKSKAATCVKWLKPIPVTSGERRWCDTGLPIACGSFEVSLDMQMSIEVTWPMISSYKCSWACGVTEEQFEIYPKKGEIWAVYRDWNLDDWSNNPDSLKGCKFELVEIVSDFSKYFGAHAACLVRVDGFTSIFERQIVGGSPVSFHVPPNNLYIFSHNVPAYRFNGGELDKVVEGMFELDLLALPDYMIQEIGTLKIQKASATISSNFTFTGKLPSKSSATISSNFTFTGKLPSKSHSEIKILMPSWSPQDFATGQVWAVYWGKDFMPRQYVRIDNVISDNHVCVTFLESLPVLDHEIERMREELAIACGIFKVSERRANIEMSLFCYLVKCQESTSKSCYKIYPLKNEIWAMYKGWNAKWKISEYERCQWLIVQILSDFSEGDGIGIARLEEVKGCLTFFRAQQYDGFDLTHEISGEDMLSFSHRIPAFGVPGIDKYGISESSWHLEPDALPFMCGN